MGLLPLNHFDDPPQLSLQVVLLTLKRIMCLRLSRTRGLSHMRAHTHLQHKHVHTHCISGTGWMMGVGLGSSLEEGGTMLKKLSPLGVEVTGKQVTFPFKKYK